MTRTSAHDTAAAISHLARELKAPRIANGPDPWKVDTGI